MALAHQQKCVIRREVSGRIRLSLLRSGMYKLWSQWVNEWLDACSYGDIERFILMSKYKVSFSQVHSETGRNVFHLVAQNPNKTGYSMIKFVEHSNLQTIVNRKDKDKATPLKILVSGLENGNPGSSDEFKVQINDFFLSKGCALE